MYLLKTDERLPKNRLITPTNYSSIYDVQADTFYSFEEAWDMDFSELRETFLDIMSGDEPIKRIL